MSQIARNLPIELRQITLLRSHTLSPLLLERHPNQTASSLGSLKLRKYASWRTKSYADGVETDIAEAPHPTFKKVADTLNYGVRSR